MFVYNVKVNGGKIFKVFFTCVIVLIVCILGIVIFKVFNGASNSSYSSDLHCVQKNGVCQISASNYTNILKAVHDDIDSYVGVKIHFSGYVYRLLDFSDNQFILARDMVISSDFQTVVVGFLCEADNAKSFADNSWVEITGEIVKGEYHGDMPIVRVTEMKSTEEVNEEMVYPPDDSYIPTSGMV